MNIGNEIKSDYRKLLSKIDQWFNRCLETGGSKFSCRGGCSTCCRGLFDITLLDAFLLKEAFTSLPTNTRNEILQKCNVRLQELLQLWPVLEAPYILNRFPDDEWAQMPEDDETPCPLLDDKGYCVIYNSRPLTCRLHGLPNIDYSGEDFEGVICTLHEGDPLDLPDEILRWSFRDVFYEEILIFRKFTELLTGTACSEIDTFIPLALLADYDTVDWESLG